jgi:hypothetical protein
MKRMIGSILASSLQFGVHVKLEDMKLCIHLYSSILMIKVTERGSTVSDIYGSYGSYGRY